MYAARRANDLDGASWTRYSISIWSDIRKTAEEVALKHPAMFPEALAGRLIECFSRRGMTVLDPFLGVGSTLLAAKRLGRHGIGIELNPEYAQIAERRLNTFSLEQLWGADERPDYRVIVDDANNLDQYVASEQVDLVVTSPPYWDILLEKRTADYKPIRHYGNEERDLGKIRDYSQFIDALRNVFSKVFAVLRPRGYCCVVVMDIRKRDRLYSYHSDFAAMMQQIGFEYDDLIVWDRRHEYNNLRPLGYPAVFRVNKVHEFILIFKKLA
ncbi:MAG: site-specific DNA-methyltransferase [Anaerolineae bacterium]|nr:site-specific DNA-methyltransferase [Anaerolineae bacterium]